MIRLVADSGSTKTDWALISFDAPEICFSTLGLNPSLMPDNQIREILRMEVKTIFGDVRPDEVFFYGAGCRKTIAPLVEYALCDELKCKKQGAQKHQSVSGISKVVQRAVRTEQKTTCN